jgi:hypothetical protein
MRATTAYILDKNGGGGGVSGVSSVNSKTGAVTLTKADIGLGNVPNTDTTNASNISLGTLADGRLSTNVTLKGNIFNGAGQLIQADSSGKVPLTNMPIISANILAVANQTARLALTQSTNLTICIQSDTNWVWGLNANTNPALTTNWIDMGSADAKVASVNGSTGVVTITCATIGAIPTSYLDTDATLSANSDTKIATQKAVKGYVDGKLVGGAVEYISAYQSAMQSLSTNGTILNIDTKIEGNMTLNADHTVTLKAGKTYQIIGGSGFSNGVLGDICFKNITTNTEIQGYQGYATNQGSTIGVQYTPSSDCKIALVARIITQAGNLGLVQTGATPRQLTAWFTITQIGASAITNVPDNMLTANVVLKDGSQVLTNKALVDLTTKFIDNLDNTKAVQFECGGITTGTTRTLTIPDKNGTIALTSDTTPTNDKASSGYFDIGTMRMQWGKVPTGTAGGNITVTLPAPFANANYVVTATGNDATTTAGTIIDIRTSGTVRTTTTFMAYKSYVNTGGAFGYNGSEGFDWIAIGLKP